MLVQLYGAICIIGSSVAAMIASLFVIDPALFGPGTLTCEPIPALLALPLLLFTIAAGLAAGLTIWIVTAQRFSSKGELERYLTEPYIPLASELIGGVFNLVYNAVGRPKAGRKP